VSAADGLRQRDGIPDVNVRVIAGLFIGLAALPNL